MDETEQRIKELKEYQKLHNLNREKNRLKRKKNKDSGLLNITIQSSYDRVPEVEEEENRTEKTPREIMTENFTNSRSRFEKLSDAP